MIFFFFSSTGAVSARNIMLLKKKQARCQGVVCAMKVSDFKFHLKMKCYSEECCSKLKLLRAVNSLGCGCKLCGMVSAAHL